MIFKENLLQDIGLMESVWSEICTSAHFIGSVRAPPVSHRSKEQILVLLMGYRPFTALSSSSPHALETVLGDKPPCDGTDGCAIAPVQPEWTAGSASCYKQRERP